MPFHPSGEQVELRLGDAVATVVEVGGGLRTYSAAGREIVDGYAADEMASAGRGQVLLPWPNRVEDGRWSWEGSELQLGLTEVKRNNANHGLVRWSGWELVQDDDATAVARHVLHPQTGYPFRLTAELRYRLTDTGLVVEVRVENRTDAAAPVGLGFHPYLAAGGPVDECSLTVPAARWLEVDDRGLPVAEHGVEEPASDGADYDFRAARTIGAQLLDTPYTDLSRDGGLARVVLDGPAGRTTLWADDTFGYLQVFTGDTVPQSERRRRGLAVEPMTCPANALKTGKGLVVLEPGEALTGSWGISPG
jgi:aldose 1-epimerase